MIQQNELITFLIGTGAFLFILINRDRLKNIPGAAWLMLSYLALYTGWLLTVLEGFFLPDLLNALEHGCYMVSSLSAAAWCWFVLIRGARTP